MHHKRVTRKSGWNMLFNRIGFPNGFSFQGYLLSQDLWILVFDIGWSFPDKLDVKSDIGSIQNCQYKPAPETLFVQLTVNNDVMLVLEDKELVKTLIKRMRLNL